MTMKWTNRSVIAFAEGGDPIGTMERRARAVVLDAIDRGWSGPPFDPLRLADILGIKAVPTTDVPEARTIALHGKFAIEFNPTRPRGRVRFSIAHEIAHTLFVDCKDRVRNRQKKIARDSDDWQLELLCNIGASEIVMPVGTMLRETDEQLGIGDISRLRKLYDVSTEALLIRIAKLTHEPLGAFCVSVVDEGSKQLRYKVDYLIPSRSWSHKVRSGVLLPDTSVVRECTTVGYSAKGVERWSSGDDELSVECVALPPYPGSIHPRVVGFLRPVHAQELQLANVNYLHGDALRPRGAGPRLIAHVVNDKTPNWGGGGFAVALRRKWPLVQDEFKAWAERRRTNLHLGMVHVSQPEPDIWVISMVAQKGFGPSHDPRIRYSALEQCLHSLASKALECDATVHMPRIGTGNARGSWPIVEELVVEHLTKAGIRTNVYDLPSQREGPAADGFLEGGAS